MSSKPVAMRDGPEFQKGTRDLIRADADKLSIVPDGWFYPNDDLKDEVYDATLAVLQRLADRGAIQTRTVSDDSDNEWERYREYRLTEDTRKLVNDVLENRDAMMPCGHSGLRNRGDHFECAFELCDGEFQREDINDGQ